MATAFLQLALVSLVLALVNTVGHFSLGDPSLGLGHDAMVESCHGYGAMVESRVPRRPNEF